MTDALENMMSDTGLWAIMLAGGEGTRLKAFVQQCLGSDAPKQFCTFVGKRTMLQHTIHRASRLIPRSRMVVVGTEHHRAYMEASLGAAPSEWILLQPFQRDTAPGLLLALVHVLRRDPAAVVAVFPTDHFVQPGWRFMETVSEAVRFASQNTGRNIVVLGAQPTAPEPDYGWIQPGQRMAAFIRRPLHRVEGFVEKPAIEEAGRLMEGGWLWNTMVIVAPAQSLFDLIAEAVPQVASYFAMVRLAIGTQQEKRVVQSVYRLLPSLSFSAAVLARHPERLAVLPVHDVVWSDWGRGDRVVGTLRRLGLPPPVRVPTAAWPNVTDAPIN